MAVELKFHCSDVKEDYLTVSIIEYVTEETDIRVSGIQNSKKVDYIFDVQTAIKLTKTLRTKINQIKSSNNG